MRVLTPLLLGALLSVATTPVHAQDPTGGAVRRTVISANPFGLLLDLFNAELEIATTPSVTVGAGGSTFSRSDDRYVNADVFARYYPSGQAFDGWNLGVKLGVTSISPEDDAVKGGTHFGYGFDVNHTWMVGADDRLAISAGFGLKRIVGAPSDFAQYIPTVRVINVGWRF